jgi:hypothetical protein
MVTVCAWCQKYMGSKEPLDDPGISHGICSACVERQMLASTPVLVVSPARVGTIPLLQSLLRGAPDVAIVVDRRSGERRNGHERGNGNGHGNDNGSGHGNGNGSRTSLSADRRLSDRRRSPALYLV